MVACGIRAKLRGAEPRQAGEREGGGGGTSMKSSCATVVAGGSEAPAAYDLWVQTACVAAAIS